MKIDPSLSRYHEDRNSTEEFDRDELSKLRMLLRRLRFLEANLRDSADTDMSGGAVFAESESQALEWVLLEVGFLLVREPASQ